MSTFTVHTGNRETTGDDVRDLRQPVEIDGEMLASVEYWKAAGAGDIACEKRTVWTLYRLASGEYAVYLRIVVRHEANTSEQERLFFPTAHELATERRYAALYERLTI